MFEPMKMYSAAMVKVMLKYLVLLLLNSTLVNLMNLIDFFNVNTNSSVK